MRHPLRAALFILTLSLCLWCVLISFTLAVVWRSEAGSAWFGGASLVLVVVALVIYAFPGGDY